MLSCNTNRAIGDLIKQLKENRALSNRGTLSFRSRSRNAFWVAWPSAPMVDSCSISVKSSVPAAYASMSCFALSTMIRNVCGLSRPQLQSSTRYPTSAEGAIRVLASSQSCLLWVLVNRYALLWALFYLATDIRQQNTHLLTHIQNQRGCTLLLSTTSGQSLPHTSTRSKRRRISLTLCSNDTQVLNTSTQREQDDLSPTGYVLSV